MSVELRINGRRYTDWRQVQVQRSLLQAAGQFNVSYAAATPDIQPGAAFVLLLDDQPALRGFIDTVESKLSSTTHDISAEGRDRTADLVDCSAQQSDGRTGELNNLSLIELVTALAKPYGVPVRVTPRLDIGSRFPVWSLDPGEAVWASIEKACRQRGVLAMSDGGGSLLLTRAGNLRHPCALVEGQNVRSAHYKHSLAQRYNRYVCLSQDTEGQGSQWSVTGPVAAPAPRAELYDIQVRAPRCLIIVNDNVADSVDVGDRILWEYHVRRGRGRTLEIEVAGFSAQGRLWQPNQLVTVSLPTLSVRGTWLVESVQQQLTEAGSVTRLTLMPPDAFQQLPAASEKDASATTGKQWSPELPGATKP